MTGKEDQAELMSPDMESQILGCYAKTCTPEKIKVKKHRSRAGQVAQWLESCTAPAEDLSLVSFRRAVTAYSPSCGESMPPALNKKKGDTKQL